MCASCCGNLVDSVHLGRPKHRNDFTDKYMETLTMSYAELSDEDMFAGTDAGTDNETDASLHTTADLFSGCSDNSIEDIESTLGGNKIGFSREEEIPTIKMMYRSSGNQKWPKRHVLADDAGPDGLDILFRNIFGDRAATMNNLPQLKCHLKKLLRNNHKLNYIRLASRCVPEKTSSGRVFTPRGIVESFVLRAVSAVIPRALLGGQCNWRVLKNAVRSVVHVSPGQPLLLGNIMRSFRVATVKWLPENCTFFYGSTVMALLMKWIVREFIIKLIGCHFYATYLLKDPGTTRFIYKPVWTQIQDAALCRMVGNSQLRGLEVQKLEETNVLTPLNMRLIPKADFSARPVMYTSDLPDENLKAARDLLRQLVGYSVKHTIKPGNHSEIKSLLLRARSRFRTKDFVLVTADIENAFGSVNHRVLAEILQELNHKWLTSKRFKQVFWKRKTINRSQSVTEFVSEDRKLQLSRSTRNGWKVDKTVNFDHKEICALLQLALSSVLQVRIHYGQKDFHLTGGIPQGCLLSSLFCELYYGAMDLRYLGDFAKRGILVRSVDDYLFITDDAELAVEFKQRMEEGFPDFSCKVNPGKTKSTAPPSSADSVTFCGLTIQADALQTTLDLNQYVQKNLGATTGRTAVPYKIKNKIEYILKRAVVTSLSSLLTNRLLNCWAVIARNVQTYSLLSGLKFVALAERVLGDWFFDQQSLAWARKNSLKAAKKAAAGGFSYKLALCVAIDSLVWCLRRGKGSFGFAVWKLKRWRIKKTKRLSPLERLLLIQTTTNVPEVFRRIQKLSSVQSRRYRKQ